MKSKFSDRREFLKKVAVGSCFLSAQQLLGTQTSFADNNSADSSDPHFFIQNLLRVGLTKAAG